MKTLIAHECALEELKTICDPPKRLHCHYCTNESELRELWEIDKVAYGDHSLEYEPFLEWWTAYPYGSINLVSDSRIVGSFGIYPLSPAQAEQFQSGQLSESEIKPYPLVEVEQSGAQYWYWSGLVLVPEWQHRGLLRTLLRIGLGSWESRGHQAYPLHVYGLAQVPVGRKIFERFNFQLKKPGTDLPDGLDLYALSLESPTQLRSLLRSRGL